MVKLARGGRRHCGPGRQEPVPLFPPGDLPVFGPPPVNMRRPLPPPRGLPPLPPHAYAPLPRPMPPPRMRPPPMHRAAPPFPPVCRRPGPPPPPPLRPLLQSPLLPPRPLPFMRGGRGPMPIGRNGPNMKRLGKNMKKGRNKKPKGKLDNKQPDGEHYCEICDRGWDTPEKLSEHLESHVTCQLDDCTFSAHPKVVAIHVKLQHATGLFKRITRTLDNEDIQKWRQERKRNYPTKENIERSKAERNEMEIRGERLQGDKKLFKKNKLSKRACRTQTIREPRTSKATVRVSKEIDMKEGSFERNFPTFPGTGAFSSVTEEIDEKSSVEENISDEEWQDELRVKPMTDKFSVCSILSALMNSYASDDSEIEDGSSHSRALNKPQNLNIATRDVASDSDDPPDEVKNLKGPDNIPNVHVTNTHDNCIWKCKTRKRSGKMKTSSAKMPYLQQKSNPKHITIPHRRLTLLEELLKNEIRQERNQILQCIRYIVKKNFF